MKKEFDVVISAEQLGDGKVRLVKIEAKVKKLINKNELAVIKALVFQARHEVGMPSRTVLFLMEKKWGYRSFERVELKNYIFVRDWLIHIINTNPKTPKTIN